MTVTKSAVSELSLDSTKQLRRWYAYLRNHELIPSMAATFANPDTPNAFLCLWLDRLEGIRLPRQIIDRYGAGAALQICVRISFFHESSRKFFGRTATTASVPFSSSSDGTLTLNASLYFQTRICDPTAFAVAELVVNVLEPIDGALIESLAIGFTTLNIFARSASSLPNLMAITASRSRSCPSTTLSCLHRPIFHGSVRALAVLDPSVEWKDQLRSTPVRLVYDLFDASSLRDAVSQLLQENELVTTRSIVAGLPQRAIATALSPPPSALLHISSPKIVIPEDLEPRVLRSLNQLRQRSGGVIVNRRLTFGVHNGRRFIHVPVGLELLAAARNQPFNYIFEGTTTLSVRASFDDPLIVIVIELLFDVEWRTDTSRVPERAVVCAGWTARPIYSPELSVNDDHRISMTLLSGPGRSPSNSMTLDSANSAICLEIGIKDPNLSAIELPKLLTAEHKFDREQEDIDDCERKRIQVGEQSAVSNAPDRPSAPCTKVLPPSFHKLSSAPVAVTIDGMLPNYDISLEMQLNDPWKAARYEVHVQWIESATAQPFSCIVLSMHIFGEKAFISNPIDLPSAHDFVTERRVAMRQDVSVGHVLFINERDHEAFITRIFERYATIEVWDYKSQMLIGQACLNLRHTLRQHQPSVEVHATVGIEDTNDNFRGRLGITVRHFGLPADMDSDYDAAIIKQHPCKQLNHTPKNPSEIISLTSNLNTSRSVQPLRIIDRHAIVGDKLTEYGWPHSPAPRHSNYDIESQSARADQREKLRHLEPIVRPSAAPSIAATMERGLAFIDEFRSQLKQEGIKRLIHQQFRKIRSRFGEAVLFRARLRNPYRQPTKFRLRIRDIPKDARLGGLRVVNIAAELRHCQSLFYHGNDDRNTGRLGRVALLSQNGSDNEVVVELGVEESMLFCFCFQSWNAGSVPEAFTEKDQKSHPHLEAMIVPASSELKPLTASEIIVENASNHNFVAGLKLQVEHAPFTVDRTFRFYHFNNEILKASLSLQKTIAYSSKRLPCDQSNHGIVKVRCTNDGVAFEFNRGVDGLGVLNFRYACGQYPDADHFYLLLFEDEFCFSLRCIWKILIFPRPRIDVNAIVGASQIVNACLPPLNLRKQHQVAGFTSDPSLLTLGNSNSPFDLVSNALNQIRLLIRPTASHTDGAHVLVNLMDARDYTMVYSWLIEVHITFPPISTTFDVALPLGSATKKKIRYKNGYNEDRVFKFESSNPQHLQVLTETVRISANEEGIFVLSFPAQSSTSNEVVYVFINDAQDHNEECLSFSLAYGVRRLAGESRKMTI